MTRRLALLLLLAACARMEPPPGGPPDPVPPELVSTAPEALAVLPNFDGEVEFGFDEVISEGSAPNQGTGTGDLERLVLLSPSDEVPEVRWRRNRITVRPSEGWRPDRVYRVELLPGVTDLRQNRTADRAVVTFSTGAPAPADTLRGSVIDWTTSQPARDAVVEAVLYPDSLAYRVRTDSSGAFVLGPVPGGEYLVYGAIDQNRNARRDPRESFDSLRVGADSALAIELWTFPHDTVGPRIATITVNDSLSAAVTFSQPLDPYQRLDSTAVRVLQLPDSTPIRVVSLLPKAVDDSLRPARRPADTTAVDTTAADTAAVDTAAVDTAAVDTAAADSLNPDSAQAGPTRTLQSRPPLGERLVLRVATPWVAGGRYAIEVNGVRNVNGAAADARGTLAVPERPKVPPTDSLAPDSLAPDSLVPVDSAAPARPDSAAPARPPAAAPADSVRRTERERPLRPRRPRR